MRNKIANLLLHKVKQDYNEISDSFNQTRQREWSEFEIFKDYIKNGQKVADLGCGNGRFYGFIKQYYKIKYTGIDNSEKLLTKAKKTFPKEAKFIEGNLLKLPIKDSSIDTAVCIAALHHIPSKKLRQSSVEKMSRILKPKGLLLLTAWNLFQPKYKKYIWKSRIRHILSMAKYDSRDTFIPWGKSGVKRYYYAFKPNELKKLLLPYFEILKERHGNNLVYICRKK